MLDTAGLYGLGAPLLPTQALFSHRSGPCPVCGSSMVLEQEQEEGEVEDVGIPVCEDLDLGLLASPRASTPSGSPSTFQTQPISPVKHTGHQVLIKGG